MTMDNGEGRPLDEAEASGEDPQGWYFDLPGGAWERQEEKNRTLRQRVLGNITEDEARAKSDPFGSRPADAEKKSGRGFFGRKKKEEDESPRTSAGGTWTLKPLGQDTSVPLELPKRDDSDDEEWTTEPPLKLSAFRSFDRSERPGWGEADGGWELSASAEPAFPAPQPAARSADFEDGDEAGVAASGTGYFDADPDIEDRSAPDMEGPEGEPIVSAGIVSSAGPDFESSARDLEIAALITQRTGAEEHDENRMDSNFVSDTWDDAREAPTTVEEEPQSPEAEEGISSMRKWAERRDADHPHFTTAQNGTKDEDADAPPAAPIPLRPRAHDEPGALQSEFVKRPSSEIEPLFDAPRPLPLVLRSKTEPSSETPVGDPVDGPSKWNDFFNINHEPDAAGENEGVDAGGYGLDSMRTWAQTKSESTQSQAIPDEFLKPFEWELDEDSASSATSISAIPAELLKPFAWEDDAPSNEDSVEESWPTATHSPAEADEMTGAEDLGRPGTASPEAVEEPGERFSARAMPLDETDDDPSEFGLPSPTSAVSDEPKKPGMFGRMFGRGKRKDVETVAMDAPVVSDWIAADNEAPNSDLRRAMFPADSTEDAGTLTASEAHLTVTSEGWGSSLAAGWVPKDQAAITEFTSGVSDPVLPFRGRASNGLGDDAPTTDLLGPALGVEPSESTTDEAPLDFEEEWGEEATPATDVEGTSEGTTSVAAASLATEDGNEDLWNPEPSAFSLEAPAWKAESSPTWQPVPVVDTPLEAAFEPEVETSSEASGSLEMAPESEPVATSPWWEADTKPEAEAPLEAVALTETVEETEPVTTSPWWEADTEPEVEAPLEAVALAETVEENEPVAASPWWETDTEPEVQAPVEAAASVESSENSEPVAPSPWWEAATEPAVEAPVEAVALAETVEETESVATSPWWEADAAAEVEATAEAAASVESSEDSEPVATSPWWEANTEPAIEAPVEAVALTETVEETEPAATSPWWEADTKPEAEAPVEAVAFVDADEETAHIATSPWWEAPTEPEVEAPVEAVASAETSEESEPVATSPWWEAPAEPEFARPVETIASIETSENSEPVAASPWLEADTQAEVQAPVEAAASVESSENSEPVAPSPWWEADTEPEVQAPVEAAASVETPEDSEPVAPSPWWEADTEPEVQAPVEAAASIETPEDSEPVAASRWLEADTEAEVDAPVGAVSSVEPVAETEPGAISSWLEADTQTEVETPVEAVASVEPVGETGPDAASTWWEADTEPEVEAPVEAVALTESVEETESVATSPWWEADAEAQVEAPVEAVASTETVGDTEPVATTPWWEAATEPEAEAPVEAVALTETVEETEPVAASTWWEAAAEPEIARPVEAIASIETSENSEPVATNSWLEADTQAEVEVPVEAVASVEDDEETGPVATSRWWEAAAEPAVEAVASVEPLRSVEQAMPVADAGWWEPPAEEPEVLTDSPLEMQQSNTMATVADDDPWADFVNAAASPRVESPFGAEPMPWARDPMVMPPEDDMWSDIAAHAEGAAHEDPHAVDLAASLESQMADASFVQDEEPHEWPMPADEDEWVAHVPGTVAPAFSASEEEDVILAAFERHAAMPETQSMVRESDAVFAELLGTEAETIVAEVDNGEPTQQSFLRPGGWAPQRDSTPVHGGWAEDPEADDSQFGGRSGFGGNDGAGFAPPPWAVEEFDGDMEALPHQRAGHRTKTWIRELVETGLLALLVFLSVRASFQNFKVEGSSMYPTLEDGQFLIVNKLVYAEVDMDKLSSYVPFVNSGSDPERNVFHGPDRGDIIVLKDPRNTQTDLIKRVIGLPGETIEIVDGKVYINDQLLDEPYIKQAWHDTKPKIAIPPGEFFVMGDNRDNSLDSRSSQVGLVPEDLIIGKAMLSYWPRDKFGFAPNEEGALGEAKPVLTTQRITD